MQLFLFPLFSGEIWVGAHHAHPSQIADVAVTSIELKLVSTSDRLETKALLPPQ
jgi:hypothetical protein